MSVWRVVMSVLIVLKMEFWELRLVWVCFHWVSGARSALASCETTVDQSMPDARPVMARLEAVLALLVELTVAIITSPT